MALVEEIGICSICSLRRGSEEHPHAASRACLLKPPLTEAKALQSLLGSTMILEGIGGVVSLSLRSKTTCGLGILCDVVVVQK